MGNKMMKAIEKDNYRRRGYSSMRKIWIAQTMKRTRD
jgi:hypothetical protein